MQRPRDLATHGAIVLPDGRKLVFSHDEPTFGPHFSDADAAALIEWVRVLVADELRPSQAPT